LDILLILPSVCSGDVKVPVYVGSFPLLVVSHIVMPVFFNRSNPVASMYLRFNELKFIYILSIGSLLRSIVSAFYTVAIIGIDRFGQL